MRNAELPELLGLLCPLNTRLGNRTMTVTTTKPDNSPIAQLARDWQAFRRVRPLKIGIREDLLLRGAPLRPTIAALEAFTTTREYYRACRAGAARHNVFGKPHGVVTDAEQAHADEMLALLDSIYACR